MDSITLPSAVMGAPESFGIPGEIVKSDNLEIARFLESCDFEIVRFHDFPGTAAN